MKHVGTNGKKTTTVKLCLMAGERKKELSINVNLNRHVKRKRGTQECKRAS